MTLACTGMDMQQSEEERDTALPTTDTVHHLPNSPQCVVQAAKRLHSGASKPSSVGVGQHVTPDLCEDELGKKEEELSQSTVKKPRLENVTTSTPSPALISSVSMLMMSSIDVHVLCSFHQQPVLTEEVSEAMETTSFPNTENNTTQLSVAMTARSETFLNLGSDVGHDKKASNEAEGGGGGKGERGGGRGGGGERSDSGERGEPKEPFSLIFSDDDDLEGEGKLVDTQLSWQINKVQSFLKMDRLKRTRLKKL